MKMVNAVVIAERGSIDELRLRWTWRVKEMEKWNEEWEDSKKMEAKLYVM